MNINIDKFNRDGFQIFENILDADIIAEVKDFLTVKIIDTIEPAKREIGCNSNSDLIEFIREIAEGQNGCSVSNLNKSTRDALSGHFSLDTRLSPILLKVPYAKKFQSLLKTILSSEKLYMHTPPTARYVIPGNLYAGVPPHQDISYNKHMTNFVTIWVPFVDIDEECGGVTVYEGSGQSLEYIVQQRSSDFWHLGVPTEGLKPHHITIKAGDVLVLNKMIIHGSTANRSNRTRISTDFRFFCDKDQSTKHFLDMQTNKVIQP